MSYYSGVGGRFVEHLKLVWLAKTTLKAITFNLFRVLYSVRNTLKAAEMSFLMRVLQAVFEQKVPLK